MADVLLGRSNQAFSQSLAMSEVPDSSSLLCVFMRPECASTAASEAAIALRKLCGMESARGDPRPGMPAESQPPKHHICPRVDQPAARR